MMPGRLTPAAAVAATLMLMTLALDGPARALPPCASSVDRAAPASQAAGDVKTRGFGGGQIALQQFPFVDGVTPPPTDAEGDVVAAQVDLDFIGVLGGGTVTLAPPGGTGDPVTVAGAQKMTAAVFTGHYKAEPRQYDCASVLEPNTVHHFNYFEFTLTGLLTPTSQGSPLQTYGEALQVSIQPGDNDSY